MPTVSKPPLKVEQVLQTPSSAATAQKMDTGSGGAWKCVCYTVKECLTIWSAVVTICATCCSNQWPCILSAKCAYGFRMSLTVTWIYVPTAFRISNSMFCIYVFRTIIMIGSCLQLVEGCSVFFEVRSESLNKVLRLRIKILSNCVIVIPFKHCFYF
jgi:hypothetical protein